MKVIFMGTPDFSVGTLEALVRAGHEVVLAVTQPDKPKRKGSFVFSGEGKGAGIGNPSISTPEDSGERICSGTWKI